MMVQIFQIKKEFLREWAFMNYDWFKTHGHERMDRGMYDLVWEGETEARGLADVYEQFNLYHPDNFKGHSLSVSDLVVWEDGLYFVDDFGFEPVEWDDVQQGGEDHA